jgi:hypothetical protein
VVGRIQLGGSWAVKLFLTLVLIALFGLLFWAYRSRVRTAFKAVTVGYMAILGINIFRASGDEDSGTTVILVLLGFLALWAVGWLGVNMWNRRKPDNLER